MRFVHLADVHLDTPFGARSGHVRERLREAAREAFRRAVGLAVEEGAHAFLVAGDLFDGARLSFQTERFLMAELARLASAGVQVIYATGNHDPGRGGQRAHSLEWPEGVTAIREAEPVTVEVRAPDGRVVGRVTGAGHETDREERDLSSSFPRPAGGVPEVALLHTQVVGARQAEAHDRYAPSELDALRRSGHDYWALGHVHLRQELSASPPVWYPGSLQGRGPGETGARGALLVELGEGGDASVEFRPLCPVRWERLGVRGLGSARSVDALAGAVEAAWRNAREGDPGLPGTEWLLRVELQGPCPLHRELSREEDRRVLEEDVAARLGLLAAEVRVGGLHPPVDPDANRDRQDVLGEALRLLAELEEDDVALLELRPEELAGAPRDEAAYLRSLLEGLDGEATARLLDRSGGEGP
ncbi:MAG TPA: DNA repair exonuclease [Longimicrobiales bacterium]|nr:DNA repair exonuclease [Longimicrobiales bacterium]